MCDLEVFRIPLEKFTLERIDTNNQSHIKAIKSLRDRKAKNMCFDVLEDIKKIKKGQETGNTFLVKFADNYAGYVYISNDHDSERTVSMIVQKKLRGSGYGKIILTGVSDYLLKSGIASSVRLYIKNKNVESPKMALSCGFDKDNDLTSDTSSFLRRK